MFKKFSTGLVAVFVFCFLIEASEADELPEDLTQVGLKKLLDLDLVVTSPGKKEQKLSNVSSSIYVLSQEDIRRAGVTSLPEALRLVPGVNVARVSSSQWAISVRGFNQLFSNKLLVLIDGVTVFSPLTNGVYWQLQDLILEDIHRIEVIRGPGAALWGANAVNGVINVITKKAVDTLGTSITAGGGTHERGFGSVRYGAKTGEDSALRFGGKFTERADQKLRENSTLANDEWDIGSANLRFDDSIEKGEELTVVANLSKSRDELFSTSVAIPEPPFVDNSNFSGPANWTMASGGTTWHKELSAKSQVEIKGNALFQKIESALIGTEYFFYELDMQHRYQPSDSHELVYGASYRLFHNKFDGTYAQDLVPSTRTLDRYNWFLQDEITLVPEQLHLIVGSKFEQNANTGFEYMPNARLLLTPNSKNSLWASVSRAVAPPTPAFEDVIFPAQGFPAEGGLNGLVQAQGSRKVESEDLLAYEIGYRAEFSDQITFDLTTFYNRYRDVLSIEPGNPFVGIPNRRTDLALIVPAQFANKLGAETIGGETSLEWRALNWLRLIPSYAYIHIRAIQGQSQDTGNPDLIEGGTPDHQLNLRASVDVTKDIDLDFVGRYLAGLDYGNVPSYTELDVRAAWRPKPGLEVSIVGQNLLNDAHSEFVGNLFGRAPIQIERGVYGKVLWQF